METKHMSLQSQTVRCQHCGEYYSVTYKYCPFCDAGRQEEERRMAEKKKQRQSRLGSFLGGSESERKKSGHGKEQNAEKPASPPRKASPKKSTKAPPPSAREKEAPPGRREARSSEPPVREAPAREASVREAPVRETAQTTPFYRKDGRKKTSEMTPEERAAHLAQREARAAERKRAREQAARQAALTVDASAPAAPAPTPVFEDDTLPETFGLVGASHIGEGSHLFDLDASSAPADAAQPEDVMEVIPLYLTPNGLQTSPETAPAQPETSQPEEAGQDFLQAVNQAADEAMSLVVGQPEAAAGETVVVQTGETAPAPTGEPSEPPLVQEPLDAPAAPEAVPVGQPDQTINNQSPAQENAPETAQDAAQAVSQAVPPQTAAPEAVPSAVSEEQPTQAAEQKLPISETGEELDSLLSEIRDMLAESPVPTLATEQLRKPPKPVVQVELTPQPAAAPSSQPVSAPPQAPAAPPEPEVSPGSAASVLEAPPAPVEAPPAAPAAEMGAVGKPSGAEDSPTIVLPSEAIAKAAEAASVPESPLPPGVAVDDSPTQVIPRPSIPEEPDILPAVAVPPQAGIQPESQPNEENSKEKSNHKRKKEQRKKADKREKNAPPHPSSPDTAQKKERQKSAVSPLLLILSLILIAAAVFIVVKTVMPAFQDGIFSQSQGKNAAASFTLDQTEVTVAEQGQSFTLTPIFEPEGSTLDLTWSSSDETVATVDQAGLVSTLAPGTATITAAAGGGQSVSCTVTCAWEAVGSEDAQEPAGPAISASSMTLSGEGASKQLKVTGTESAVTWASSAPEVASVGQDGTVTAAGKGVATVTAEVDGQTLSCDVKCIW